MSADLHISDFSLDGAHVVEVAGQLDLFAAPQLEARTSDVIRSHSTRVVVDLSHVSFIDSTGLSVLIGTLKRIRAARGELALVVTNYDIERLLTLTGLDATFRIHRSRDEALAQLPPLLRA